MLFRRLHPLPLNIARHQPRHVRKPLRPEKICRVPGEVDSLVVLAQQSRGLRLEMKRNLARGLAPEIVLAVAEREPALQDAEPVPPCCWPG